MVPNRRLVVLRAVRAVMLFALFAVPPANGQDVPVNTPGPKAAPGRPVYIVQMIDLPVVAYTGGLPGLSATAPARGQKVNPADSDVVRYVGYLDSRHEEVLSRVGARKLYGYRYAFNGFAAELTPEQLAAVRAAPGVISVERTKEVQMNTATTPAFLGLNQTGGLWNSGIKGENVIIGILDSGIWPESQSFSDRTGGGSGQKGKLDYHQIPGWNGKCASAEETDGSFDANLCNQKLIGAQYFCAARGCDTLLEHEFLSPRDYNGHGTHTASTAGGNEGVVTTGAASLFGSVNGIAPRARISAYKICWDNGGGCGANSGDAVAAIDQAVIDGVDVINYSIGGTGTDYLDSVEVAFLFAARAGVFVATSAGNSGPTASTVTHISPWLASVAAGTHNRSGTASVILGNGDTHQGASLTPGVGPASIVLAVNSGIAGADPNLVRQCFSSGGPDNGPVLDPAKVAGKIVVCERGGAGLTNARVDKSLAVKNADGVGVVIYNVAPGASLNADLHSLPTVHVDNIAGGKIVTYVKEAAAAATATLTQAVVNAGAPAPDVAAFSSRGPSRAGAGDILKPDFMAPGVDIVAAVAPPGNGGKEFDIYSGTSMASPHAAGIAALLSQAHPEWSPAAKRSAIATTADALSRAGLNQPFNVGSGHVRPNLADNPGIVYDVEYVDYLAFLKGQGLCCASITSLPAIDASDLNQPSLAVGDLAGSQPLQRTVTNVGGSNATYNATVVAPAGYTVTVNPTTLLIPAGGKALFHVTLTRTDAPLNNYRFGSLTWSDGVHTARSPIVVRPVGVAAPAEVNGTGSNGSLSYTIKTGYAGTLAYAKRGLIPSTTFSDTVTDDSTDNFDTTKPTENQGIQTHDIVVPGGTSVLRISMFDPETDGADDLDLYLYRVNADSSITLVGLSGSGTSAEQIQLANPPAATYRLFVHGWQTDGPDANYTLHAWILGTSDAGNMTVTGPATAGVGTTSTVNLSWSGLEANRKYFGAVLYQEGATTHATTLVRIDN